MPRVSHLNADGHLVTPSRPLDVRAKSRNLGGGVRLSSAALQMHDTKSYILLSGILASGLPATTPTAQPNSYLSKAFYIQRYSKMILYLSGSGLAGGPPTNLQIVVESADPGGNFTPHAPLTPTLQSGTPASGALIQPVTVALDAAGGDLMQVALRADTAGWTAGTLSLWAKFTV